MSMKEQDLDTITVKKKCPYCGKEFTPKDNQKYCGNDCYMAYNAEKLRTKAMIKRLAKKYDFDVKNIDKIVNAKMLLFVNGERKKCPCDATNPKRFCGSALCIHDVVHYGHCHCNLFHLKNFPDTI